MAKLPSPTIATIPPIELPNATVEDPVDAVVSPAPVEAAIVGSLTSHDETIQIPDRSDPIDAVKNEASGHAGVESPVRHAIPASGLAGQPAFVAELPVEAPVESAAAPVSPGRRAHRRIGNYTLRASSPVKTIPARLSAKSGSPKSRPN